MGDGEWYHNGGKPLESRIASGWALASRETQSRTERGAGVGKAKEHGHNGQAQTRHDGLAELSR